MAEPKDLVGTWRMLSWKKKTVSSGETVDAHGPNPVGYLPPKADIGTQLRNVRFVPKADIGQES
jgi:hypothetical protein